MIIDHNHKEYRKKWRLAGKNKYNGAFYYSKEIAKNIIPNVDTDRNWITVNIQGVGVDHSIVFIHNNLHPENYEWLSRYKDIVLVCGVPETVEKVAHIGKAIYLPLSIDVEYVSQFRVAPEQQSGTAFVGRPAKRRMDGVKLPSGVRIIEGLKQRQMLPEMAKCKAVYAVGRTAIEAKALGCEVLPYDKRFPDPERWQVVDNKDAAKILQEKLDEIDGPVIIDHSYEEYKQARAKIGAHKWNGAYYYSREIVENIIPLVKTDRSWNTIKAGEHGRSHSICFVHNNLAFEEAYNYMRKYDDVVYVVGLPDMVERASAFGTAIYLPLSVDVEYVKRFRTEKTKDTAFVGRPDIRPRIKKEYGVELPAGIDFIEGLPREQLLAEMAKYRKVYAIGRTAIEAKVLKCEVLSYHPRVPDPDMWAVIDNREAARILQIKLDEIDHPERGELQPEPDLSWKKPELVKYAEAHGIEVKSKDTKQTILDKITEATA